MTSASSKRPNDARSCLHVLGLPRQTPDQSPAAQATVATSLVPPTTSLKLVISILPSKLEMSTSNSSMMVMMVPWLHFTGGDSLIFESWHPSSHGAIAGACIGLVLFAMFERWVNAMRGVLDVYWRKK